VPSATEGQETDLDADADLRRAAPSPGQLGEAFLLCREGTQLQVVPLLEGAPVTFGRGAEADVHTESTRVSRLHARFSLTEGVVEVHDLGSRNGTMINGALVRDGRAALDGGDVLNIGPVEVVIARAAHGSRPAVIDSVSIPSSAAAPASIDEISDGIIVADSSMVKLFSVVRRLAAVTSTVLVTGETGVGKEVVAEHVHKWSARAAGPFVRLNCASLPENLLESELYGHERGAFTGAERRRTGYFEAAHGGTLLLDEIGEMPLNLQAKLLRVLETRTITRLGGTAEIPVDVRILCATHRELRRAVTDGRFRQDLYYRISAFTLEVPPLRERPTELLLLAELFARRFARQLGRKAPQFTPAARKLLTAHRWPGNVRELRNVMEHSIVLHDGRTLDADNLPDLAPDPRAAAQDRPRFLHLSTPAIAPMREQMHDVEREAIRAALNAEGGNRTRAAKRLEMSRRGLIYKMIKYGLRDD
jgi:two-component system response regulator AtoC